MRGPGRGFTLVELLVSMLLLVTLTLAILAAVEGFARVHARTSSEDQAQGAARELSDGIVRDLRNGADGSRAATVLQRADPTDLVFTASDPVTGAPTRIRYCVAPAASGPRTLWRQSQPWSGAGAAASTTCPDPAFASSRQMSADLVPPQGATSVAPFTIDGATPATASRVWVTLAVAAGTSTAPPAALTSGVTLRNQNRPPTASFTATPTSRNRAILNGSGSADPDDQTLTYAWTDGAAAIGSTAVLDYQAATGGTHQISLTVTDPAGASATVTQAVVLQ